MRNGHKVAYNHADGRGNDLYSMTTSYTNIKIRKGDKVWIRTRDNAGQFAHGGHYCNFSGVKV